MFFISIVILNTIVITFKVTKPYKFQQKIYRLKF
nr:MAG TPA: hypothetical protein [Caudoviricetes sp.]